MSFGRLPRTYLVLSCRNTRDGTSLLWWYSILLGSTRQCRATDARFNIFVTRATTCFCSTLTCPSASSESHTGARCVTGSPWLSSVGDPVLWVIIFVTGRSTITCTWLTWGRLCLAFVNRPCRFRMQQLCSCTLWQVRQDNFRVGGPVLRAFYLWLAFPPLLVCNLPGTSCSVVTPCHFVTTVDRLWSLLSCGGSSTQSNLFVTGLSTPTRSRLTWANCFVVRPCRFIIDMTTVDMLSIFCVGPSDRCIDLSHYWWFMVRWYIAIYD